MTPLSLIARKARLAGLRDAFSVGGAGMALFYTDSPPGTPDSAAVGTLLATATLSQPCGVVGESGALATLELTPNAEVSAVATGVLGWVRFANGAGAGLLDLPVGLPLPPGSLDTPAPVIVNTLQVFAGGAVQMLSCVLAE